ncbi:MAG: ATP-binding cassette domain-containing protein [Vicinamibacterales bacterium]
MHPLSTLPGRVRWHVPVLRNRPVLAQGVAALLRARPEVTLASANPLTGNLLLEFAPDIPEPTARAWVVQALEDAVERPPEAPLMPMPFGGDAPLARLIDRTRPHRGLAIQMLGASFLNRLLDSSPPILIGAGIDIVSTGRSSILAWMGLRSVRAQLFGLGGLGLAIWAADATLDYMHRSTAAEFANRVRNDLRNDVYQHLQTLDLAQFESRDVSAWIGIIESDLARIHSFIKDGSDPIIAVVASGLAVVGTVLALSPGFALLQLLLIPPVLVTSKELLGPLKDRLVTSYYDNERLSALIHGNLSSLPTIVGFASQESEAQRVLTAGQAQMESTRAANNLTSAYVPTLTAIVGTEFMASIVWGGLQVEKGALTAGNYNVVTATQLRMLAAVGYYGASLENYQRTTVAIERVFEVLDMKPGIVDAPEALPFTGITRGITFEDVTFAYEADRKAIRNMSLTFPAGHTVGIVGSSGAGKSTVLKLLLRFYDVQAGAVKYDGVDVRDLRMRDLRGAIATVAQDLAVFAGTVRDNIAYARPGATDEEVEEAAMIAEAHEFIMELPEGYATAVGYGGHSLSGGQRQRLAIARVVLADRPILLFDEATSSLDYETEAAVQRSLAEVTAGRTTVIVAHRLSTIRNSDLIYVLDEGQVKEMGRHDELVAADGIYASMWRVQTGEQPRLRPRRRPGRSEPH